MNLLQEEDWSRWPPEVSSNLKGPLLFASWASLFSHWSCNETPTISSFHIKHNSHKADSAAHVHLACMNSSVHDWSPKLCCLLHSSSPQSGKTPQQDFGCWARTVLDGCSFFFPSVFFHLPWLFVIVIARHIPNHEINWHMTAFLKLPPLSDPVTAPSLYLTQVSGSSSPAHTSISSLPVFQLGQPLCFGTAETLSLELHLGESPGRSVEASRRLSI